MCVSSCAVGVVTGWVFLSEKVRYSAGYAQRHMRSKSVKGNKGWLETTHLTWPLHPPKKQVVCTHLNAYLITIIASQT